jgi:hypothetical protein
MTSTRDESSPAWCRRLLADLDEADRRATALVKGVQLTALNWRPTPGEWSVGQCIEHLCISNDVYVPPMAAALERKPRGFTNEITPGWFGRWFIRTYIEPSDTSWRRRAPNKIAPPTAPVDSAILDRFLTGNADGRTLIQRAAGYDINKVRFRNPFVPLILFTIGTGMLVLVRHQHRHLLQAERVKQRQIHVGSPRGIAQLEM